MRSCTFRSSYCLKLATSGAERYIQFSEEQLEQVRIPEEDTDRVLLASQLTQKTMRFSRVLFTPTSSQRPSFSQCFLFICPFSPLSRVFYKHPGCSSLVSIPRKLLA